MLLRYTALSRGSFPRKPGLGRAKEDVFETSSDIRVCAYAEPPSPLRELGCAKQGGLD